jgi:hypothetical protein
MQFLTSSIKQNAKIIDLFKIPSTPKIFTLCKLMFQAAYKSALQQQYEQQQYNMLQRLQGATYIVQQRPLAPSVQPGAKSTENLISSASNGAAFGSSLSCECLEDGTVVSSPMQEHPKSHFLSTAAQRKSIDSIFYNSQPSTTTPQLSRNSSMERTNELGPKTASRPPMMVEKSEVTRL